MTKLILPLSAIPSQQSQVVLDGQQVQFWLRQLATGLYIDLTVNGALMLAGCLCVDRVDLLRGRIPALTGLLYFRDMQGRKDPGYTGLKNRFQLIYEV